MLTESKFIVNAALKQKVDTLPVGVCKKSEEMAGEYPDYRDIPVYGASMCFPNGWTLLVEIDESEVVASLTDYLQQNMLSASATFLLILFALYLFNLGILSPLQELSGVAQKIGKGDFSARATITRDEFGELTRIFNEMIENVQIGAPTRKSHRSGNQPAGDHQYSQRSEAAKSQLRGRKPKTRRFWFHRRRGHGLR